MMKPSSLQSREHTEIHAEKPQYMNQKKMSARHETSETRTVIMKINVIAL